MIKILEFCIITTIIVSKYLELRAFNQNVNPKPNVDQLHLM